MNPWINTWESRYPQEREHVIESVLRVCSGFNEYGETLWHDIPRADLIAAGGAMDRPRVKALLEGVKT